MRCRCSRQCSVRRCVVRWHAVRRNLGVVDTDPSPQHTSDACRLRGVWSLPRHGRHCRTPLRHIARLSEVVAATPGSTLTRCHIDASHSRPRPAESHSGAGGGIHSRGNNLRRNFLIFLNHAFCCILYFWTTAGSPNVAGPGVTYFFTFISLSTGLSQPPERRLKRERSRPRNSWLELIRSRFRHSFSWSMA